jgi:hypothetical protein
MYTTFDEGGDESVQRALNDAKRTELTDRFGLVFGQTSNELPAAVEADFLSNVEEFEIQWAAGRTTTVREYVGNPAVLPVADVPEHRATEELERILSILAGNNVYLDVLTDVPATELYRFIVEELLDEEMNDVRVHGMDCHFIYEEFHPDAEYDAKLVAEWFLHRLFNHSEYVMHEIAEDGLLDAVGAPTDRATVESLIGDFRHAVAVIIESSVEIVDCAVNGERAWVRAKTGWRGYERESMNELSASGDALVALTRGQFEEWEIVQFAVPGVNLPAR